MARKPIYFLLGDMRVAGGQERVMSFWSRFLTEHGWQVTFVDENGGPSYFDLQSSPIEALPMNPDGGVKVSPGLLFKRIFRFSNWLKQKPTAIILMTKTVYLTAIPFLRFLPGTRKHTYVYYSHTSTAQFLRRFPLWLTRFIFSGLDRVFFLYDDAAVLPTWFRQKMSILPNPSPFPARALDNSAGPQVLSLGRFSEEKGLELLLEAWALIEKNPNLKNWRLRMVGEGPDEQKLKKMASDLHLGNIDWAPATKDVLTEYAQASVVVMTSHYEALPMVLIEALACGKPVVSTETSGSRQILTGLLAPAIVPGRNAAVFAKTLSELLLSPETQKNWAMEGLKKAAEFQPGKSLATWDSLQGK